jgi:AcrR family transcriptional regulator
VIEIQRARLLAAMVEVSGERGAANVTVAHVVERAGVSRRTFYELFRDRDGCFLAAFEDAIERAERCALDAYDPSARWAVRIASALQALLSFLDAEPGIGHLLIVDSLGAGAGALARRRGVLAQIVAVVDEGRAQTSSGAKLPPLTAEGVVGGALSVLHARLLARASPAGGDPGAGEPAPGSLVELTGPLMGMIVLPYLGQAAARRQLARPVPRAPAGVQRAEGNPLGQLEMRLTYRTVRVLAAIAELGGQGIHPSNREIGVAAEVPDQGQMSKLLARLSKLGLVENSGIGQARGAPNAWVLTGKGVEVERAIGAQIARPLAPAGEPAPGVRR